MAKVSLNLESYSTPAVDDAGSNVGDTHARCALEPVMVGSVGVEAIFEGLRFANIQGFVPRSPGDLFRPAQDVDARDGKKRRR